MNKLYHYLEYNLPLEIPKNYRFSGYTTDAKTLIIEGIKGDWVTFLGVPCYYPIKDFKPVLRPVSDLDKECTIGEKTFVPLDELTRIYQDEIGEIDEIKFHDIDGFTLFGIDNYENYELSMPLKFYEKLLEWHFDIYNILNLF